VRFGDLGYGIIEQGYYSEMKMWLGKEENEILKDYDFLRQRIIPTK
jgi:hypothetical protein